MTPANQELPHPLLRDGTSRGTRPHPALPPESVSLDGRSIADLLVWSVGYAGQLLYYNASDVPDGTWRPLWDNDVSSVIAEIDSKRPLAPGALFYEIDQYRSLQALAKADRVEPALRRRRLRDLCNQIVQIPRQFETWRSRVAPGLQLERFLREVIDAVMKPAVTQLRAYDLGATALKITDDDPGSPLALDYQGLDVLWDLKSVQADPSIYQGVLFDDQVAYAIQRLAFLFDRVQAAYVRLVHSAMVWMEESLQRWPRHEPHFALFLAFLQLFRYARDHLNAITGRHLEFYYRRVLRLERKGVEPDQAHLVFQLAPHLTELLLPKGTLFNAGKDATGVDMHYALEEDFLLNPARVARIQALYVDAVPETNATDASVPQIAFHVSPQADSADGQGAPLDAARPRWKTFGANADRPKRPLGFALASPMFFLAEGKRRIAMTLTLSKDDSALLRDLFKDTPLDPKQLLQVALSTEKEWYKPPPDAVELDVLDAPMAPDADPADAKAASALRVVVNLPPEAPPIAVFPGTDKEPALDVQWPVLRLGTSEDIPTTLYHRLATGALDRIDLEVSATGMRELVLETDLGPVSPHRPFQPFGPIPKQGSAVYVGCWEAFQKSLTELSVHLEWMDVPPHLENVYLAYDSAITSNLYFRGRVYRLDSKEAGQWAAEALPHDLPGETGDTFPLFLKHWEAEIIIGNRIKAEGQRWIDEGNSTIAAGDAKVAAARLRRIEGDNTIALGVNRVFNGGVRINDGNATIQRGRDLERTGYWYRNRWWFGWWWGGWWWWWYGSWILQNAWQTIAAGQRMINEGYAWIAEGQALQRQGQHMKDLADVQEAEGARLQEAGKTRVGQGNDRVTEGQNMVDAGKNEQKDEAKTSTAPGVQVTPVLKDYPRMPGLARFTALSRTLARGFMKVESAQSFRHEQYPRLFAQKAIEKTQKPDAKPPVELPQPPYTPTLQGITLDYRASESIDVQRMPEETVERIYHLHPFGQQKVWPLPADDRAAVCTLLPDYQMTSREGLAVKSKPYGALYLGITGLVPPRTLSLLVQVVDGSADPETPQPEVNWQYLVGDEWKNVPDRNVLADRTNGLIASGIIWLAVPADADTEHSLMPSGHVWLKADVHNHLAGICDLAAIQAQAVRVRFMDRDNDPSRLTVPLAAQSIAKPVEKRAGLAGVAQPFASFDGRTVEAERDFNQRVSERLRHRDRAITIWDYERLVLERFPSIYKVKCISHTDARPGERYSEHVPGAVTVIVIPDLRNQAAVDPLVPRVGLAKLAEIEAFLRDRTSPFIADRLKVINPLFERISIKATVSFRPGEDQGLRVKTLEEDLKKFLSPWAFEQQSDISFGGSIHGSAMVDFIDERDYVDAVLDFGMSVRQEGAAEAIAVEEAVASSARSILVSDETHTIKHP